MAIATKAKASTATQVFVRMYRSLTPGADYNGWLGDCFLIRILGPAGASHILIDCGILLGSADAANRVRRVTDDIIATTGGKLDLLVVTHEHWDHISGFSQAHDVFLGDDTTPPKLKIGKIWMAWTENLADPLAKDLAAQRGQRSTALANLVDYLKKRPAIAGGPGLATMGLEAFIGVDTLGATGGTLPGREVMARLKTSAPTEYCDPTNPSATPLAAGTLASNTLQTPGATSLRAYVLGPPRTKERLFKDLPSSGAAQETYLTASGASTDNQTTYLTATACNTSGIMSRFGAAADDGSSNTSVGGGGDSPFGRKNSGIAYPPPDPPADGAGPPDKDAADDAASRWAALHYGNAADSRTGEDQTRRRIDDDWLAASGGFALKLDSDTNNTSLVLAFELPDGGVMLFAADAQVGNWLSWHDQDYAAADGRRVTAADLLSRTRLYKVGHHGSHNATLAAQGLEMMTNPDLVALIPTDEAFGLTRPGDWKMPNGNVNTALIAATKGRILRNDRNYPHVPTFPADPKLVGRLTQNDLFTEVRVYG
jgi:hypothetical protein